MQDAVSELYAFRDHYFENHSIDDADKKLSDVQTQLDITLKLLDNVSESVRSGAEYLMLRGHALNVMPQYSKEAEECLSKAVKLEPKLAEAWCYLGECYWKNNQIESAQNCFVGSLNHKKHKLALRNLSMVLRQLGSNADERQRNIEESVKLAKEAIQLDISDGTSWFILGNAYMMLFFTCNQNGAILNQCLSAYQQAEKDPVSSSNCDLHFNRATIQQFQELYSEALAGYTRAVALDPTFKLAREKRDDLLRYLTQVTQLVQTKGKLRGKRLQSLIDKISLSLDLGPYAGGSYTSSSGLTVRLQPTLISQLVVGVNPECVVVGRVVCTVASDSTTAFTLCIVDSTSSCCSVTVYNVSAGWGVKIGDSVAIPEPYFERVDLQHVTDLRLQFDNIRIASPIVLVVNGRKQSSSAVTALHMTVSTLSD